MTPTNDEARTQGVDRVRRSLLAAGAAVPCVVAGAPLRSGGHACTLAAAARGYHPTDHIRTYYALARY